MSGAGSGEASTSKPESVFRTPSGLEILQHRPAETNYVYQEIFGERVYLRHGIRLADGAIVFDVGANIGLFTIFVQENFKAVRSLAFEPSPIVFALLQQNVSRYGPLVSAHQCGIADRAGTAKFTFFPSYSIISGFHEGTDEVLANLRAGIKSHLLEQGLSPEEVTDRLVYRLARAALAEREESVAELCTLSQIIEREAVSSIDLLKIDAEGSELAVLAGIEDGHWSRIRQIVAEIHDPTGGDTEKARSLLEGRGFKCVFEEQKGLGGSGISNCFARRTQ
jgi:FkbM family methyltransferase